jgi:paraquat-inducible protein B
MNKQASPAVIGGFVLGAVALLVAALLLFGSGKFFTKKETFVAFFRGSVTGLTVGAPVRFRGVRVGSVKAIVAEFDSRNITVRIPVYCEILEDRFHEVDPTAPQVDTQRLIEAGLRAQLQLESLVTGQLYVSLDFFPDTPVRLVGAEPDYSEIPTLRSTTEKIADTLRKIPMDKVAAKALDVLNGIDKFVNDPVLLATVRDADAAVIDIRTAFQSFNSLISQVKETDEVVASFFAEGRTLIRGLDGQVDPIAASVQDTLREAKGTLARAQETLDNLDGLTGERSDVRYEVSAALTEVTAAARSLRALTDMLARRPDALLFGKGRPKAQ